MNITTQREALAIREQIVDWLADGVECDDEMREMLDAILPWIGGADRETLLAELTEEAGGQNED